MIFVEKIKRLSPDIPSGLVEQAAAAALRHQSAPEQAALSIVLADDKRLHGLNQDYLGVDAPTDVLSFAADQTDPETGAPYLGDIIISVQRAGEQAARAGHPVEAEVQLLVVHGVLHLMGHDHADADDKAHMWQAQAEILEQLGLAHIQVREE